MPMQRCLFCGHELPLHARFCGKCGHRQIDLVLIAGQNDVEQQRLAIAEMLHSLVQFALEDERAKNTALFTGAIADRPSIKDPLWGRASFIAGVYEKYMWDKPYTFEQKLALWQALTWAVQYEHYFRPQQFANRFHRLVEVYSRSAEDHAIMASARPCVEVLISSFDEERVQDAKKVLAKLIPSAAIAELERLIERQEEKLRVDSPPPMVQPEPEDNHDAHLPEPELRKEGKPGENGQEQKKDSHPKPFSLAKRAPADEAAGFLGMLPEDQRHTLVEYLHSYQIERVGVLLRQSRQSLLETLYKLLAHPSFKQSARVATREKGGAVWEKRWNLAVTLVSSNNVFQALEVLKPGVETHKAPYPHLRFALTCAVDVLRSEEGTAARNMALSFLVEHLTKLPLVDCYLAWVLLAGEAPGVEYHRQLEVISGLQELLNRPITIILPMNKADEVTIEDFEQDYQDLIALIQRLEGHYTLESEQETIGIKSTMFATSLLVPHRLPARVGLFVDIENLWRILPATLPGERLAQPETIVEALNRHAQQFGEIVCRWLSVSPVNVPELQQAIEAFRASGFSVQYPHGQTVILQRITNLADFVLLECISFEMYNSRPDVCIIVSGDSDYYEKIMSLLEQGHTVRLIAAGSNLSSRYRRLQQKSREKQLEGSGEFYVDTLESILHARKMPPALGKT
jgi:NYN domain